jgi:UDP-N-acetylmuramoyl-L-alanyl-D-glutamate--2,6-diaminopimelate ligase
VALGLSLSQKILKKFIQKFIPVFLISWYHFCLAYLGAFAYGFPSKKLIVIGVTGTKGKTTTCNLIAQILNKCGYKTGMASTVNFRIGEREWINETKQTMLGRFKLQKLLRKMVNEGCKYAVLETSSEGILQYRHRGINYNIAVFTNLTPEHIERHGGFENYRRAKLELFKRIAKKKDEIAIINLDDENAEYFLDIPVSKKYGYCHQCKFFGYRLAMLENKYQISNIKLSPAGAEFEINFSGKAEKFKIPLIGEFNVYNAMAAICVAVSQKIPIEKIKNVLIEVKPVPGRMEIIDRGQNFTAIVDYSYELASFENALKNLKIFNPNKIITVIGPTGGGRDKWRRPKMGEMADKYADIVIITTDDPYDENPKKIIKEMLAGVLKNPERVFGKNVFEIIDRRQAIKKAISLADEGDVILFAGKGGEKWMNLAKGEKIPWDESEIVREEIKNKKLTNIEK